MKACFAPLLLLTLTACGADTAPSTQAAAPANAPAAASSLDAEYEQLKATTPVDACSLLTPEKLAVVFPGLEFEVHQEVKPQMSGYVWDSRCTYWTGVGSVEFAKDVPTHTVEIFIATSVSDAKAQANLASRHEGAKTTTGYQALPALGADAHTKSNTGYVSLFFVKGPSEVQINFTDLETPVAQKIETLQRIAQGL